MAKNIATIKVVFNNLPKLSDQVQKKIKDAVRKTTFDIQAAAQNGAPVGKTGNLKNSIQAYMVKSDHGKVIVGAHYGMYVNFGTVFMHARPFWDSALERNIPSFQSAIRQALKEME